MSAGTAKMNDASFASLSPTLLARKGGARPAMRPQHGGILGSIGSTTGQDTGSEDGLDDLGWNDMGDEHAPHDVHDVIKLTPAPLNEQMAAQARQMDEQTGATLAEFSGAVSPAREQQEVLAKRIEKKSPPILSDAIMSNDDDPDEDEDETGFGVKAEDEYEAVYAAEHDLGLDDAEYDEDDDDDYVVPSFEAHHTPRIEADHGFSPSITAVKPSRIFPEAKSVQAQPPARAHRVAAIDQGKRAAFTLRLDAERHLQLRLASTITGRSAQQIVTDALDAFLAEKPELAALASQVKRPGTDNT